MAISLPAFPRQRTVSYNDLAPSLHLAVRAPLSPDFRIKRRIYDFFLCCVLRGELSVSIDGSAPIAVTERKMFYIPAGVWHESWVSSPSGVDYIGIHFDYFSEKTGEEITVDERNVQDACFGIEPVIAREAPFRLGTSIPVPGRTGLLLEALVNAFHDQTATYALSSRGLLLQLLAQLWQTPDREGLPDDKYGKQLAELADRIRISCSESWSNARVASWMNMHEDHAVQLFKRAFGKTPCQYLQQCRLVEAKRLLRETDLKVESIGQQTGYPDVHYFSRIFRKSVGVSPSAYRRTHHIF